MFELTDDEAESLRSQIVTLDTGRGRHRKYLSKAFTEEGVAMLSSVLRSQRAVPVNIEIMRAFVQLRRFLGANEELVRKLDALERKDDGQFRVVFQAIRELMTPSEPPPPIDRLPRARRVAQGRQANRERMTRPVTRSPYTHSKTQAEGRSRRPPAQYRRHQLRRVPSADSFQ